MFILSKKRRNINIYKKELFLSLLMLPIIKPGIRGENKKSDQME